MKSKEILPEGERLYNSPKTFIGLTERYHYALTAAEEYGEARDKEIEELKK